MKKILFLAILISNILFAQDVTSTILTPFENNKKYGYKNANGEIIIPTQFDEAEEFNDYLKGFAIVKKENNRYFIDAENKLSPPFYDILPTYIGGTLGIVQKEKDGLRYITDGKTISQEGYDKIPKLYNLESFGQCGWLLVEKNKQKYFTNINGEKKDQENFGVLRHENTWLELIKKDNTWVTCGRGNVPLASLNDSNDNKSLVSDILLESDGTFFHNGLAVIYIYGKGYGYVDRNSVMRIPAKFAYAENFKGDYAVVAVKNKLGENKEGLIKKNGEFLIDPQFSRFNNFYDGYAMVEIFLNFKVEKGVASYQSKYGYISKQGNIIIEPIYDYLGRIVNGVVVTGQRDSSGHYKYGYINISGESSTVIAEPQFFSANEMDENGLALISIEKNKFGYIDKTGTEVICAQFFDAHDFSEGLAAVAVKDKISGKIKYGFIDKNFSAEKENYKVRPQFINSTSFSEGFAAVVVETSNGVYKTGFINPDYQDGNYAITPTFDTNLEYYRGYYVAGRYERSYDLETGFNFYEGRCLVLKDGKWVKIDKTGTIISK